MLSPSSSPESKRVGIRYISDAVKHDHRSLEKLYTSLLAAVDDDDDDNSATSSPSPIPRTPGPDRKRELQQRFCWELARHLVAMNLFIFPGTKRRASQGNQNAMDRQDAFALLRSGLLGLEGEEGSSREALVRLRADLARHIREVERTDLVAIEKVLSGEESERLARDFEATAYLVPPAFRGGPAGEDVVRAPPFESPAELLDASVGELMAALEVLPRD